MYLNNIIIDTGNIFNFGILQKKIFGSPDAEVYFIEFHLILNIKKIHFS